MYSINYTNQFKKDLRKCAKPTCSDSIVSQTKSGTPKGAALRLCPELL